MANINDYVKDGFVKVCTVAQDSSGHWHYKEINQAVMYSSHNSWIYFIVVDEEIVKCGETGNPLGIMSTTWSGHAELQPITGTKSRLGRYRKGDGTDCYIRENLRDYVGKDQVSIWALRCEKVVTEVTIAGKKHATKASIHKDLELEYLNHFFKIDGRLPLLNKAHK